MIKHNVAGPIGTWVALGERVVDDDGEPLWIEHPRFGKEVDVVALPLTNLNNVKLYPYSLDDDPEFDLSAGVSEGVSIVGFPFGFTGGGGSLAIWSRGFIATEPDIDFDGLPLYLIDSRTRQGQSGSPVIVYQPPGTVPLRSGQMVVTDAPIHKLIGIYSGRVNSESDLGFVWKIDAIREILDSAALKRHER